MSVRVSTWVWHDMEADDLSSTELLVMLALADEANDEGLECYPSQKRIAAKVRKSVRSVRTAIEKLEDRGLIVVTRPAKQGRGHYSTYQILLGQKARHCAPSVSEKSATERRKSATERDKSADQAAHTRITRVTHGAHPRDRGASHPFLLGSGVIGIDPSTYPDLSEEYNG